jgi:phosphoribosylaminoimidazole-succinocarboxamide synthase
MMAVFVDVLGTPDECRFGLDSQQVSKEVIRQWYRKNQPSWAYAIPFAKKVFGVEWKNKMIEIGFVPVKLPKEFHALSCQMYPACSNKYTEIDLFDVNPLEKVMDEIEATGCAIYVTG